MHSLGLPPSRPTRAPNLWNQRAVAIGVLGAKDRIAQKIVLNEKMPDQPLRKGASQSLSYIESSTEARREC
jgi:hypothetical protein